MNRALVRPARFVMFRPRESASLMADKNVLETNAASLSC
jgi:hypothetical protein